jgi:hypothetical protein
VTFWPRLRFTLSGGAEPQTITPSTSPLTMRNPAPYCAVPRASCTLP